jgi:hypothetical protein
MTDDFTSGFRAGIEKAAEVVNEARFGSFIDLRSLAEDIRALLPEGAEGWRTDMENAPRNGRWFWGGWTFDDHAEPMRRTRLGWHGAESGYFQDKNAPDLWRPLLSPPTGKGE